MKKSYCIPLTQLCDGRYHCPLKDDEKLCNISCPPECTCVGLLFNCTSKKLKFLPDDISHEVRMLNLTDNLLNDDIQTFPNFRYLIELYMQNNRLTNITEYLFHRLVNLRTLDLRNNLIIKVHNMSFAGLGNLTRLYLQGNKISILESGAFLGLNSLQVLNFSNQALKSLEPGMMLGLTSLKILDLSNNYIDYIHDEFFVDIKQVQKLNLTMNPCTNCPRSAFKDLRSLQSFKSDHFMFCCFLKDVVPQESCEPKGDEISSCQDLMRNQVLRTFIWLFGFCAFLGNMFALLYRFKHVSTMNVNDLLVANLALSDFWMGVYLLIIAAVDMKYRGVYVEYNLAWRKSWLCSLSGFLATLSSEASVFTLCVITLDRLICITNPFSKRRFSKNTAITVIAGRPTCLISTFLSV